MPEVEPQDSSCRLLAGIPFEVRCATHRIQQVDLPGYADFRPAPFPRLPLFAPVEIVCRTMSVSDVQTRVPERFLDGGAWGYYVDSDDAVFFAPLPISGQAVQWWARIPREATRRISIACTEALLIPGGGKLLLADPFRYPLDQLILVRMLADRGLLLHAAAAVRFGRTLIFPGVSGAGKTTLSRLLDREAFTLLSDDRVVVRRESDGFSAWGTPWPGEGGYARNEQAPLAGVCFLKKGPAYDLRRLSPSEALPLLLKVASVPWYDPDAVEGPLECVVALLKGVPVYELTFSPEEAVARNIVHLFEVYR